MSIDYNIQFPCQVRAQVSDEDLMRMRKTKLAADGVAKLLQQRNPGISEREVKESKIIRQTNTPTGSVQKEVSVAQMLAEAAPLDALSASCVGCPANLRNVAFGCNGSIEYPISSQAEEWLIARLPADVDDWRLQVLLKYLAEFKLNGSPVDSQRSRKDVYKLDKPISRKWGGMLSKKSVTSSQVIQVMVMMGNLAPGQTLLLDTVFDLGSPDLKPPAEFKPEDPCITQFKEFMRAAAFAANTQTELLIDA